ALRIGREGLKRDGGQRQDDQPGRGLQPRGCPRAGHGGPQTTSRREVATMPRIIAARTYTRSSATPPAGVSTSWPPAMAAAPPLNGSQPATSGNSPEKSCSTTITHPTAARTAPNWLVIRAPMPTPSEAARPVATGASKTPSRTVAPNGIADPEAASQPTATTRAAAWTTTPNTSPATPNPIVLATITRLLFGVTR